MLCYALQPKDARMTRISMSFVVGVTPDRRNAIVNSPLPAQLVAKTSHDHDNTRNTRGACTPHNSLTRISRR